MITTSLWHTNGIRSSSSLQVDIHMSKAHGMSFDLFLSALGLDYVDKVRKACRAAAPGVILLDRSHSSD